MPKNVEKMYGWGSVLGQNFEGGRKICSPKGYNETWNSPRSIFRSKHRSKPNISKYACMWGWLDVTM